jgi:hypothetical protein
MGVPRLSYSALLYQCEHSRRRTVAVGDAIEGGIDHCVLALKLRQRGSVFHKVDVGAQQNAMDNELLGREVSAPGALFFEEVKNDGGRMTLSMPVRCALV